MRYYLIIVFLLNAFIGKSQSIEGNILNKNANFLNKIYLLEIKKFNDFFSRNYALVIDSADIDINGNFEFKKVKANSIFRLNVIPKGRSALLINDGVTDNYSFLITPQTASKIVIKADADSFYRTCTILENYEEAKQVNEVKKMKMPVYIYLDTAFAGYTKINPTDTPALIKFQQDFIINRNHILDMSNKQLFNLMPKYTNALVKALSISYYVYDNNMANHIQPLKHEIEAMEKGEQSAIVSSIVSEYKKVQQKSSDKILSFDFVTMNSKNINISTLDTKVVILDFWASWCAPCRKEIKGKLPLLTKKYAPKDLQIIGVNMDEKITSAKAAIKNDQNKFLQIWGYARINKQVIKELDVQFMPHYIVIDIKAGKIYRNIAAYDLEKKIDSIIN